jgi:hypothetical protein
MRRVAIHGGLAVLALAAMSVLWFFPAQWWPCSSIRFTPRRWRLSNPCLSAGTAPNLQFGAAIPGTAGLRGFNRGERLTGAHLLELTGPGPDYKQAATLEINSDDRLVLAADGRRFVFGARAGTMPGDDGPIPAFAAEPSDKARKTEPRLKGKSRVPQSFPTRFSA